VVVTARVHDPDGISSFVLRYRVDPSSDISEVVMRDDGTAGDDVAADGLFSATVPGQAANTIVAFHGANDGAAAKRWRDVHGGRPRRECLVRFGESQPGAHFGTYRL